jgi:hypothetical protein
LDTSLLTLRPSFRGSPAQSRIWFG